ncbi:hypothetical protein AVEN_143836-1 [Araneus ventricosus]|uniref:Uncharacterized protein n=1 Tax=Araneus ventricosus TaxID=182803 RepID=A0A4Y2TAE5_ARAVE|nr:hypothetical protein AVEN_143836-1 [Araneus ventricosus]
MREYAVIHEFSCSVESAMSLQIFCLCLSNFTQIFIAFSTVLGFHSGGNGMSAVGRAIIAILNLSSFFAVAGFALGVSQEDENTRQKMEEIAFDLSLSEETEKQGKVLYRFINLKKKLIFSAWGVFSFTRGFLLTSIGVLNTYNLLLLQLDTYHGNLDN